MQIAVKKLVAQLETAFPNLPNARWVALRLLNGDERIAEAVRKGEIGDLSHGKFEPAATQIQVIGNQ